jgi:hypothetical protein
MSIRCTAAAGKKPSSGSWVGSSTGYRPNQVRKALSSAATSAACKTPNCRRIKSCWGNAMAQRGQDARASPCYLYSCTARKNRLLSPAEKGNENWNDPVVFVTVLMVYHWTGFVDVWTPRTPPAGPIIHSTGRLRSMLS